MAKRRSALKQINRKLSGLRGLFSVYNRYNHAQARAAIAKATK